MFAAANAMRLPDPRERTIEGAQGHVEAVAGEFLTHGFAAGAGLEGGLHVVEDVAQAGGQRSLIAGRDGSQRTRKRWGITRENRLPRRLCDDEPVPARTWRLSACDLHRSTTGQLCATRCRWSDSGDEIAIR